MPNSASFLDESFTYTIDSIDIERCSVVVTYLSDNANLVPYILNVQIRPYDINHFRHAANNELIYSTYDDIPFHAKVTKSIEYGAPVEMWKIQKEMVENIEYLNSLKV